MTPLLAALAVPGMTQVRLARVIGVHKITVAKWKAGTHAPDGPTLMLLSIIGAVPPASWPEPLAGRWVESAAPRSAGRPTPR